MRREDQSGGAGRASAHATTHGTPDHLLWHPNRETSESRSARFGTIALMILTIVMLLLVALGGWNTLQGGKPIHIGFMVLYVVFIVYVQRWNRGVLPVIAGAASMLAVFALVAGPAWFARDKTGFNDPAFSELFLGILTLGLIPIQMLLIVVAMWGFSQKWNVEELVEPRHSRGDGSAVTAS